MSVGISVTKQEIDSRAGEIASRFQGAFDDVAILKLYLDATPDETLVDLGYSAQEVATIKTAFTDLSQLGTLWVGTATLTTPKDFRAFAKQLWGLGAF